MGTKKFSSLLILSLIFLFSVSFQQFRFEKERKPLRRFSSNKIRVLNSGLPFRSGSQKYAEDQVLVKFKPAVSTQSVNRAIKSYELKSIHRLSRINVHVLQIPEETTVEEMVYTLNRNPDIEYAEPNYKAYLTVTPNDTYFSSYQYALYNSGQEVGPPGSPSGINRADIKATEAWEETTGSEDIVIAVLDTGVDLSHPDIDDKIVSGGRDFANDDYDATDDHGHGTHVAGIAAAETNNNEGIAGVSWNSKILPVKVMDEYGEGFYSWIIRGLEWAADNGADIINLSIGGDAESDALKDALRYAFEKEYVKNDTTYNGIVIVASAGNEAAPVLYPAAYDEYCIAVGASNFNDEVPGWSNSGPEVDVCAPGSWVISLWPEDLTPLGYLPYVWAHGTSMAAPHVAGLAALIRSIKPWLTPDEIMKVIKYSADDINASEHPGPDDFAGYGRINMEKALVPIKVTSKK